MSGDEEGHVATASAELAIVEGPGIVLLQGPSDLVEEIISNDAALAAREPAGVSSSSTATQALAHLSTVVSHSGDRQVVFQLDEAGMELFRQGKLAPGPGGFMRLFGRGAGGKISGHGALKPVTSPQRLLSAQLAMSTLALTAAIKDVQEAVERVEAKVDRLRDLLESERTGEVLGAHGALARRAEAVGFEGSLSGTDWHAIDDLGIAVEQQIESLRAFVRKRLRSAADRGMGVKDRAEALQDIKDLSETLSLLVVAQDSLFIFQQLRLTRIRDHEADRLTAAIDEAAALIDGQRAKDQETLDFVARAVTERWKVEALEIHRFISTRSLAGTAGEVAEVLEWFADQRALRPWPADIPSLPTFREAWEEAQHRGASLAGAARRAPGAIAKRARGAAGAGEPLPPVAELERSDEQGALPAPSSEQADQGGESGLDGRAHDQDDGAGGGSANARIVVALADG